jgi:hypothetical protein
VYPKGVTETPIVKPVIFKNERRDMVGFMVIYPPAFRKDRTSRKISSRATELSYQRTS